MASKMFSYDPAMADLIFDYCRMRLQLDPVALDFAGDKATLEEALAGLFGPKGNDPKKVMEIFSDVLAPAVISCDSPRFLAFIPAAPTRASMLFDMIVSCSSLQGTSWLEASGAVAAENQALRVLADFAGLPQGAGGVFVSGGSAANLSALVVARDRSGRPGWRRRPLRIAISDETHSSVRTALRILDMEALVVPAKDHRLTGEALRDALESDHHPEDVVAVVATAGTTNAGIVDDLAGIAEVTAERDLWFHVDGAYGAAALFATTARGLFKGIEHAHSLVVDPHKWLFAPFDCAALLYREPSLAKSVFTQQAGYLDVLHTGDDWNPSDYAYHLTRRARGLPYWFSMAVHGTDAYGDAVEAALTMAKEAATRISAQPHLELIREPVLSIVLFRRHGWNADDYEHWSERLLADQVGFVTQTLWEGETVARFAFLHPDTTVQMVDEILATMA
jgi:glutamate/tyrosine decarboxylase-like PLP-dependent enzyme